MKTTTLFLAGLLLMSLSGLSSAREKKEYDSDVNYDESKVPRYDLPDPLVSAEGKAITAPDEWMNVRRPQILSLFANLVYGRVPVPESPIKTEVRILDVDKTFMHGKAVRKRIAICFKNKNGRAAMTILVFVPNKAAKPVPAFMMLTGDHSRSSKMDADEKRPGKLKNGWPVGELFDRGYALVSVCQQDLVLHNDVQFEYGIHRLFFKKGQSFPKAHEWGVITAVGWGAMRALDYLETDDDVNQKKVALLGHSKLGKATLWAVAQDQRFAMAISAQSGCAGAALWRRRSGETLAKMVTRFPYWLCRNAWKFVNQEDDLPVDQHMLLALIAPRPVYVHSSVKDTWADPRGEYLSA